MSKGESLRVRERKRLIAVVGTVAVIAFLVMGNWGMPAAAQLEAQPAEPTNPENTTVETELDPKVPAPESTVVVVPDEVIEPTQIPEPTATIVPTEIPTQHPEPTLEPTPTPAPTPTPTIEPPVPFDPTLTCNPGGGDTPPVAGATNWSWLDCTITWATKDVASVKIRPIDPVSGWEIVPVNDRGFDDPVELARNELDLVLLDDDPSDAGFFSSRFAIASRLACEATPTSTFSLEFVATSGHTGMEETVVRELTINAVPAALPEVQLTSALFSTVDVADGAQVSIGTITLNYANASAHCGWTITTVVDDFVSPDGLIPASSMTLIDASGVDGARSSQDGGAITIHSQPGGDFPISGTITLTVSVPVPATASGGDYATTITSTAGAP